MASNLVAMVALLVVLVVATVIVRNLQVCSMIEDCMMSQRPSCELVADRLRLSRLFTRS